MSQTTTNPAAEVADAAVVSGVASVDRESAWRSRRAWSVLLGVTAFGLFADLWTKSWAFGSVAGRPVVFSRLEALTTKPLASLIPVHSPMEVIPGVLEFTLVLNPGAVFGIGAGKRWFFIVVTCFAIAFGLWLFGTWTRRRDWLSHSAIGMLLSGGIGNLYDRLVYGCVRDFIHPLPRWEWPFGWSAPWGGRGREIWPYVSNVADALLLVGIAILIVRAWRTPTSDHPASGGGPGTGAAPSGTSEGEGRGAESGSARA